MEKLSLKYINIYLFIQYDFNYRKKMSYGILSTTSIKKI